MQRESSLSWKSEDWLNLAVYPLKCDQWVTLKLSSHYVIFKPDMPADRRAVIGGKSANNRRTPVDVGQLLNDAWLPWFGDQKESSGV